MDSGTYGCGAGLVFWDLMDLGPDGFGSRWSWQPFGLIPDGFGYRGVRDLLDVGPDGVGI